MISLVLTLFKCVIYISLSSTILCFDLYIILKKLHLQVLREYAVTLVLSVLNEFVYMPIKIEQLLNIVFPLNFDAMYFH